MEQNDHEADQAQYETWLARLNKLGHKTGCSSDGEVCISPDASAGEEPVPPLEQPVDEAFLAALHGMGYKIILSPRGSWSIDRIMDDPPDGSPTDQDVDEALSKGLQMRLSHLCHEILISREGTWSIDRVLPFASLDGVSSDYILDETLCKYYRHVLQQLGFAGTLSKSDWWAAAKSVGFSSDQFRTLPVASLCRILEAKICALNEVAGRWEPKDTVARLFDESAKSKGGRPRKFSIDGKLVRSLRKEAKLKQSAMAEICGIGLSTYEDAEKGKATDETIAIIAGCLSTALLRKITAADLTKK